MATIGKASLVIVPKFDGLQSKVDAALGKVKTSGLGERQGGEYSGGFKKGVGGLASSGALVGAFSAITTKALSAISSHVGDAVSRFDTLNNYPKVMQSLGYSAEGAQGSISKMAERLQALPTRLDDMVSVVQGIAVCTGDLDKATDAGLALNDMLVASGSSTQLVNSAMEQFRQMLSKGKPEMEDWKSLTSAMPGQMDQLAKSMLGPTANANDLYAALGGGKNEATKSMDDLLEAMIRLDSEGGESFASFQSQAETAAGGVATSMSNLSNAVTKGLAGTMDAIGKDRIASYLNKAKQAVNGFFSTVNKLVPTAVSGLEGFASIAAQMAVPVGAGAAAVAALNKSFNALGVAKASDALAAASLKAEGLASSFGSLVAKINPVAAGVGIAAGALVALGTAVYGAYEKQRKATEAVEGFASACRDSAALGEYSGRLEGVGVAAAAAKVTSDDFYESLSKHAEAIEANNEKAQQTIAQVNTLSDVVGEYCGKAEQGVKMTDLGSEAQGKLAWAAKQLSEQLGANVTAQDILNGAWLDAEGNARNLKESVDELVEAKIKEAKTAAITENITEAYKAQQEAVEALRTAQGEYATAYKGFYENYLVEAESHEELATAADKEAYAKDMAAAATKGLSDAVDKANSDLEDATANLDAQYDALGQVSSGSQSLTEALEAMGAEFMNAASVDLGASFEDMAREMQAAGVSASDLNAIGSEQLTAFAKSSGGSLDAFISSVKGARDELAASKQSMTDTISSWQADIDSVSTASLVEQLAQAGVSTEELNSVGSENFAALWASCDGDVSAMVAKIVEYRNTQMGDKHTTAEADGNVIDRDAKRALDEYIATNPANKSVVAQARGNVIDGSATRAAQNAKTAQDNLANKHVTWSIDQVIRQVGSIISGNAAGGFRPHAEGGVRMHASGAIATRALPLDIVGEAGAEAIVPLTNERYSKPFAKTLARQMAEGARGDVYNVYLDGKLLEADGEVKRAVAALVGAARRQKAMGRA